MVSVQPVAINDTDGNRITQKLTKACELHGICCNLELTKARPEFRTWSEKQARKSGLGPET